MYPDEFYGSTPGDIVDMIEAYGKYEREVENKEYLRQAWFTAHLINSILSMKCVTNINEIMPSVLKEPEKEKVITTRKDVEKMIGEF